MKNERRLENVLKCLNDCSFTDLTLTWKCKTSKRQKDTVATSDNIQYLLN